MKRKISVLVCSFLLLFVCENTYADENFVSKRNFGDLGFGTNVFQDRDDYERYLSLLNIGIEHVNTRMGIELTPYFVFKWNFGDLGLGINVFQDRDDYETYLSLLNIGIEHVNTRIGIELTPYKEWAWQYFTKENKYDINEIKHEKKRQSYLNLNIYWNVLDIDLFGSICRFYLGPFNKFNYLFFSGDKFFENEFIYTAGVRLGLGLQITEKIYFNLIGMEMGYRNSCGRSAFYIGGQVDFVFCILVWIGSAVKSQ